MPEGGSTVRAFDTPDGSPRPFPLDSMLRNGAKISPTEFDALRASFQVTASDWGQQFSDALNRGVLNDTPTN